MFILIRAPPTSLICSKVSLHRILSSCKRQTWCNLWWTVKLIHQVEGNQHPRRFPKGKSNRKWQTTSKLSCNLVKVSLGQLWLLRNLKSSLPVQLMVLMELSRVITRGTKLIEVRTKGFQLELMNSWWVLAVVLVVLNLLASKLNLRLIYNSKRISKSQFKLCSTNE
jgi:hypothetical protein